MAETWVGVTKRTQAPLGVLSVLAAFAFAGTAQAGLLGSTVTGTFFYPEPTTVCALAGLCAGPLETTVQDPGVEFPTGSLVFDGSIDVSNTQIVWDATLDADYSPADFNGFQLTFAGAPTITKVTLDSATTLAPVSYSFTGDEVTVNLEGLDALAGQETILDVQTSGVPEPTAWTMMLLGLAGVGGAMRLARRQRAPTVSA